MFAPLAFRRHAPLNRTVAGPASEGAYVASLGTHAEAIQVAAGPCASTRLRERTFRLHTRLSWWRWKPFERGDYRPAWDLEAMDKTR